MKIWVFELSSFSIILAAAVFLFAFLVWRRGRALGFSEDKLLDFVLFALAGLAVGARFFGFWGGLLGLVPAAFYLRRQRYSPGKMSEVCAPAGFAALGLVLFGRGRLTEGAIFAILGAGLWGLGRVGVLAGRQFFWVGLSLLGVWRLAVERSLGFRFLGLALAAAGAAVAVKMSKTLTQFSKSFLAGAKERLLRRRGKFSAQVEELAAQDPYFAPDRARYNPDWVEDAAEDEGHNLTETLKERLGLSLREVKKALARFKIGKYGVCEVCGGSIDKARLKAYPEAIKCLRCEERGEGRRLNC